MKRKVLAYILAAAVTVTGIVQTDIEMLYGQMLHIELEIDRKEESGYRILAWKVYHSVDYEIDKTIPVWTGD